MTDTHAKRIAFHLEGLLTTIDPANPKPVVNAVANAVASAYHDANATHDQRVAFALAMLKAATAALQQVEAETGWRVDEASTDVVRFRMLTIRDAADAADTAVQQAAIFYGMHAQPTA